MVIIIGAGPVGLAAGIALRKRDIPFLIIDKGSLVHSLYRYPVNMTFFSTSDRLEIGGIPFISHNTKPTRREALEYYRRVAEHFALPLHLYEEVTGISGTQGEFTVATDKATYAAEAVIVASGFYGKPHLLGVPGEDLPHVKHYYDEPHPYAFRHLVVVGAGNSAVDVALETYRAGSKVTMLVREPAIKDSVKYWVKPDIENRIREGSIGARFNTLITRIEPGTVWFREGDGPEERVAADFVLAMTGYEPDFGLLEAAGVRIGTDPHRTPEHNPDTLETNVPGLYLAGVICGGLDTGRYFIENTRHHGEIIAGKLGL